MALKIIRSVPALRQESTKWRAKNKTIGFVPTMGALHKGHMALIQQAQKNCDKVVVSIFVNPGQFAPGEDFSRYPRTFKSDLALLKHQKVDVVFHPACEEIYPDGFSSVVSVRGISEKLEGAFRPGHFDGVATIVTKLFGIIRPDMAFFGEKDYQQLQVIRHLVADLNLPVKIGAVPTLREKGGLAMSSRNRYLTAQERKIAPKLYAILQSTARRINNGEKIKNTLRWGRQEIIKAGFAELDYLELCHADTFLPVAHLEKEARLLAAVWLGKTRLIDNIKVNHER